MAERGFYKLSQITKVDVAFLKLFFGSAGTASLRRSHHDLIDAFKFVADANELIQHSDRATTEDKRRAQLAVIEIEDKLHGQIEQDAVPLLAELRKRRAEFIQVDSKAITFFRFLAHQYFRTKRMRAAIGEELSQIDPSYDFGRLTNIVCHIGAENVGSSLFVDRFEFDIIFLDDRNGVGFITGDQPIVNLMGTGDGTETTELVLYYPLGPDLSCLVVPREHGLCSVASSGEVVEALNDLETISKPAMVSKSPIADRVSRKFPPARE